MKVKVINRFVDRVESVDKGKEILRAVGDEFTVSEERFIEIKRAGDFVEEVKEVKEVKTKPEPKKIKISEA